MFCLNFFQLFAATTILLHCWVAGDKIMCGNCESETYWNCCKVSGLGLSDEITTPHYPTTRLIIVESRIENIPESAIIKNLRALHIMDTDLNKLRINDFKGAGMLEILNLTRNKIENLQPNIFIFAPNINVIDLSNNRITEVSEYSFENIKNLKILVLSNNFIQKLVFNSNLVNLEVLMIGNNSLTYLDENLLRNSSKLTELCINDNKLNISSLNVAGDLELFDMSNSPTSVLLRSQYLKVRNAHVKTLNIDNKAVKIDASENQIHSIVVVERNFLIELNLSKNNYTTMQNLTALKSLRRLDLSFNQIQDFTFSSFSNMTELIELNLENSGLKLIDFGFFTQQHKLIWLDISYNNLKEINLNMLPTTINSLYIEGNALTNIDSSDISLIFPKLSVIGLANNKFSCEKLIAIRKHFAAIKMLQMYVDPQLITKPSKNINGIACENENSTETMELSSTKLFPIHTGTSDHNKFIDTIQMKIEEIENSIRQHNDSWTENSRNSEDDILSLKEELTNIRNDGDLKLIVAKSDILMSVSRLFNVSVNGSNVNVDLKATIEELNKINLDRYQSLSLQLKVVNDKLEDVVRRATKFNDEEKYNERNIFHLKPSDSEDDFKSLKKMMTFIVVAIVCMIFGFSFTVFYKNYYKQYPRYVSSNTVNPNFDQSLV